MKKRFKNFCNGVTSTSSLKQGKLPDQLITTRGGVSSCMLPTPSWLSSSYIEDTTTLHDHLTTPAPTLEEIVARLDLKEAAARRAKAAARRWPGPMVGLPMEEEEEEDVMTTTIRRRMSCVNSSDILNSAKNALNQYPRFSLDGRDALYRSSFQNRSLHISAKLMAGKQDLRLVLDKNRNHGCVLRPATLAGQTVVWCKPGIIPKLMGLESMPLPLFGPTSATKSNHKNGCIGKLEKTACLKERTCKQGTHGCGRTGSHHHTARPVHFEAVQTQGPDPRTGRIH